MLRIFILNLSGRLILVAISIVSVPIYIRYIGVANYGIIGIYNSLAGLAAIFDVAFSNTINRELAKRNAADVTASETGTVFRTLEIFAWLVALTMAGLLVAGASVFVEGWIGAGKYPGHDIVGTVRLMGLLLLLQAPVSFYSGCLYGMHRHALINGINVSGIALSTALAIGTVIFVSPTIDAFFIAQFAGRLALLAAMAIASYTLLIRDVGRTRLRGSIATWRKLWRFAAGMNGIGILSLVINQADMVILSRFLSATAFGSYTIARTVSQSLVTLAMPAYQSAFPQLSKVAHEFDPAVFAFTFHRFCRFLSFVLIPPGVVICVFAREILRLWTHNPSLADNAWPTLSLLAAGSMVYGLSCMISAVQMAEGAVRSMIFVGLLFVGLLVPALILLVHLFNQSGAALAWLIVNIVVLSVSATITLRRYMAGALKTWIAHDIMLPLITSALPAVFMKVFVAGPVGSTSAAVTMMISAVLAVGLSAIVLPEVRTAAFDGASSILTHTRRRSDGNSLK